MAKSQWADLSDAQIAKRRGRILDVVFNDGVEVGFWATLGGLGEVGEDTYVALEVETKHTHPAENVLQYWPWLERSRRRLVLVHAIAPDARKPAGPSDGPHEVAGRDDGARAAGSVHLLPARARERRTRRRSSTPPSRP